MAGEEWHLACDTCFAGDGPHYHPWFMGLAFVCLAVAALVWLVSRRGSRQVVLLGRIAVSLFALGPGLAFWIVTSGTEGHYVPCGPNFSHAPCIDHGTAYRNTAATIATASVVGGIGAGLAAAVVAFRRRGATDPGQYMTENV